MTSAATHARPGDEPDPRPPRADRPLACVVVNPSKPAATAAVRHLIRTELESAGYLPIWLETTLTEPGATQARAAVASGARLVVAAGGDGTVRAVAAGVAGTGVSLGIVPLGTANLAARNLDLPCGDLAGLVRAAVHGHDAAADLAWVRTEPLAPEDEGGIVVPGRARTSRGSGPAERRRSGEAAEGTWAPPGGWARPTLGAEHACMVVAGVGFDAGLVADTHPHLKRRIGWGAYAVAAFRNLDSPRMDVVVGLEDPAGSPGPGPDAAGGARTTAGASACPRVSDAAPSLGIGGNAGGTGLCRVERFQARNVLVANGGRLPAGIVLLPEARVDDGLLDVAAIDTVAGLVGWASLARQVLLPEPFSQATPGRTTGRLELRRARAVTVRVSEPALVEVDGELLPPTRGVRVRLDPGALLVRRPAP